MEDFVLIKARVDGGLDKDGGGGGGQRVREVVRF